MRVFVMMYEGHIDPEDVERYSLGHTSPAETADVEEHLLVCDECRGKVEQADEFAIAMKAAAGIDRSRTKPRWKLIPVLATAACLMVAATVALRWQGNRQPAFAVNLAATRANPSAVAAPAGRALELHPDLTGLPVRPSYRMEMVDQNGTPVWRGEFNPAQKAAMVEGQAAGVYFVRISTAGGELLREYGLEIGPRR